MKKTNVMRILDKLKIEYTCYEYEFDEEEFNRKHQEKDFSNQQDVFKTLVAITEHKQYVVFVLPISEELDLKKTAKAIEVKKIELIPVKEINQVTGYIRGSTTCIGMKKQYPTYIDETYQLFDKIKISAGVRGMQIEINPSDLILVSSAKTIDMLA